VNADSHLNAGASRRSRKAAEKLYFPLERKWEENNPSYFSYLCDRDFDIRSAARIEASARRLLDHVYLSSANLIWVKQGRIRIICECGEEFELGSDTFMILYSNRFATFETLDRANVFYTCTLSGTDAEQYLSLLGYCDRFTARAATPEHNLDELLEILGRRSEQSDNRVVYWKMLEYILESHREDLCRRGEAIFYQALKVVMTNVYGGIRDIKSVYTQMKISRPTLYRLFKRNTGMTLSRFIDMQVARRGMNILRRVPCTIAEASVLCGFSSPAHFSFFMRRLTGLSPRAFRGVAGHVRV